MKALCIVDVTFARGYTDNDHYLPSVEWALVKGLGNMRFATPAEAMRAVCAQLRTHTYGGRDYGHVPVARVDVERVDAE